MPIKWWLHANCISMEQDHVDTMAAGYALVFSILGCSPDSDWFLWMSSALLERALTRPTYIWTWSSAVINACNQLNEYKMSIYYTLSATILQRSFVISPFFLWYYLNFGKSFGIYVHVQCTQRAIIINIIRGTSSFYWNAYIFIWPAAVLRSFLFDRLEFLQTLRAITLMVFIGRSRLQSNKIKKNITYHITHTSYKHPQ